MQTATPVSDLNLATIAWTFGESFLIALVLTPILRDVFTAYHVVDKPGFRKVHAYPIPRLGGIAIAAAYAIGILKVDTENALAFLPGAGLIFLIGLVDDFFNLSAKLKLLGQIAAAGLAFGFGLHVPGPFWFSLGATVFWLLLATNSFNLIDGLDGLCGGLGLIATAGLFFLGWSQGNSELQFATLPLAGGLIGFLCYNFSRATMFLGDSGALVIGFLIGCFGLLWMDKAPAGLTLAAPAVLMAIPLLEVGVSVLRRSLARKPVFGADRRHIHHRLLDRGLSPRRAVLTLYGGALFGSLLGFFLGAPSLKQWHWIALALLCFAIWAGVRQLRYSEFQEVAHLLARGEFRRALGLSTLQDTDVR